MNQLTFNHSYQSDSFDPGSNTGFSGSRGQLYNNGQAFAYPGQQHNGNGGQLSFHSPAVGQFEDNTRVNQSAYGGQEIRTSVPAQTPISQLTRTSSGRHTASPRPIAPQQSYQQHAMAVPAQPSQSPGNMISAQPATPNTPTTLNSTSNLESSRISLIISINQELLQEINRLQSIGQGGAVNPQQAAQQTAQTGQEPKMASEEYIQLLRRAQGNLAWLMGRANGASAANGGDVPGGGKMLPGPAYMQHPLQMPALSGKYEELRRLFPDWPGNDAKMMAMVGNGGGSGTGSPAVGSGNAAVVQGQQQAGMNGTTTMANMSSG